MTYWILNITFVKQNHKDY